MTMSDRIAIMNDGELEQVGTPKDVYEDPASEFVGGFMGQPNAQFFDGNVVTRNGSVTLEIGEFEFDLALDPESLEGFAGGEIRVGIRPQNIEVSDHPGDGIPATHLLDEPLGDETHSFFETDVGEVIVVTPSDFEGDGQEYGLVLDSDYAKLYDAKSGVRIA